MGKRADKAIGKIRAEIDTKIARWKDRIKGYEEIGGMRAYDYIQSLEDDIQQLQDFRNSGKAVEDLKAKAKRLEEQNSQYRLLLIRVTEKVKGYGEFEVLSRQIKNEIDSR